LYSVKHFNDFIMKKVVNSANAPAPIGPYNQSIQAAGLLFISGQIGINPLSGDIVTGSIEDETRQVCHNLGEILKVNGLSYEDVVKCSVFVKDMHLFSRINAVYSQFFHEETAPARELVEVSNLPRFVNIEISAIAVIKN
jgi:2-iminobutanoate/2-iminopropanoate deaminase